MFGAGAFGPRPKIFKSEVIKLNIQTEFKKDRKGEDVVIFKLIGDLDAFSSKEFKPLMIDFVDKGYKNYIVDLSQTPFIDSSGLVSLISLLKRAKMLGGYLKLVGAREEIKEIFNITGLDKVFEFADSVDEALNAD